MTYPKHVKISNEEVEITSCAFPDINEMSFDIEGMSDQDVNQRFTLNISVADAEELIRVLKQNLRILQTNDDDVEQGDTEDMLSVLKDIRNILRSSNG